MFCRFIETAEYLAEDDAHALEALRPGIDGLVLEFGHQYVRFHIAGGTLLETAKTVNQVLGDRVEVTGVHPHAAYLRVYVSVTARARASMPCAT